MASITISYTINVPNITTQEILEAICTAYNYQDTINNEANPETKAAFAKRIAGQMIVDVIKRSMVKNALHTARVNIDQVTSAITVS